MLPAPIARMASPGRASCNMYSSPPCIVLEKITFLWPALLMASARRSPVTSDSHARSSAGLLAGDLEIFATRCRELLAPLLDLTGVLGEHITRFSLGGIDAMASRPKGRRHAS